MKIEKGLPVRNRIDPQEQDQKLKEVASLYEKQFLRELVKAMRGTVQDSGLVPKSQGEKIFTEQLDDQYVEKWGDQGGIGLKELIYRQLIDTYGTRLGIKAPENAPRGPLPLDARSRGDFGMKTRQEGSKIEFQFHDLQARLRELRNPFDGVVKNVRHDQGQTLLGIDHGDWVSELRFPNGGELSAPQGGAEFKAPNLGAQFTVPKIGTELKAGQSLGLWSGVRGPLGWSFGPVEE